MLGACPWVIRAEIVATDISERGQRIWETDMRYPYPQWIRTKVGDRLWT